MTGPASLWPRVRAVGAGLLGTLGSIALTLSATVAFGLGRRSVALGPVTLLGASLCGGAVAGRLTAGGRRDGALNGLLTGFAAGVLLGAAVAFVYVTGTPDPAVPETAFGRLYRAGAVALGTGALLGVVGLAGGWLGHRESPA